MEESRISNSDRNDVYIGDPSLLDNRANMKEEYLSGGNRNDVYIGDPSLLSVDIEQPGPSDNNQNEVYISDPSQLNRVRLSGDQGQQDRISENSLTKKLNDYLGYLPKLQSQEEIDNFEDTISQYLLGFSEENTSKIQSIFSQIDELESRCDVTDAENFLKVQKEWRLLSQEILELISGNKEDFSSLGTLRNAVKISLEFLGFKNNQLQLKAVESDGSNSAIINMQSQKIAYRYSMIKKLASLLDKFNQMEVATNPVLNI